MSRAPGFVDHVLASARLLDLPLADGQAKRVAAQLERIHAIAQQLSATMGVNAMPAQIYSPAPFPAVGSDEPRPGGPGVNRDG